MSRPAIESVIGALKFLAALTSLRPPGHRGRSRKTVLLDEYAASRGHEWIAQELTASVA